MTRKNLIILNKLRQEIFSDSTRFLFVVRGPQISRINLSILRICLSERKERGIYISIDKPDKHVKMILERHNISKEGSYVDTGIRSIHNSDNIPDPMSTEKKVLVVSGIFCPTLFLDSINATLNQSKEAKHRLEQELGAMRFIMIDNISTMAVYNSLGKIQEFFTRFDQFQKRFPNLRVYLTTDRNVPKETYQMARRMVEREVDILDEWL